MNWENIIMINFHFWLLGYQEFNHRKYHCFFCKSKLHRYFKGGEWWYDVIQPKNKEL